MRSPYCVLTAFGVPIGYVVLAVLAAVLFPSSNAGGLAFFDTPHADLKLEMGFIMIGVWTVAGFLLNVFSLIRGERYKPLALFGLCLYVIPAFMSLVFFTAPLYQH